MNTIIRKATLEDSEAIRDLLEQLGYPQPIEIIESKLKQLFQTGWDDVLVYEDNHKVLAFITLHYSVQLAFDKDFCEIGYFVVDTEARGQQIGDKLETFACQQARMRGCGDVFVYSSLKRKEAHRFYERQGYSQIEKYFEKKI